MNTTLYRMKFASSPPSTLFIAINNFLLLLIQLRKDLKNDYTFIISING